MYLLDTNVVSELRKTKPHGGVLAWVQSVNEADLYISAVTLGEIQRGIQLTRDQNPDRADQIETWADGLSASQQVLPMDGRVFRLWAKLMHHRSGALYEDAMIAATARVHQLTVVTRNVRDFAHFDVPVLNPFKPIP
jgi:predicted nucleic acid-binding protein